MNREIEDMAKALTRYEYHLCERLPKDKCLLTSAVHAQVSCDYCKIAEFLVNEDYRKSTDVAREIFAELEGLMLDGVIGGKYPAKVINPDKFAELLKRYESEGEDEP